MNLHVFYNGTDSNYNDDFKCEGRFIHGEIVSRFGFYAKAVQAQSENVLRIHGVGSSKDDRVVPGSGVVGSLTGLRMRDDVQNIVNFVMEARDKLKIANQSSTADNNLVVTLMGWSRGGIGCIYAAHMLAKVWDSIEKIDATEIKLDIKVIAFDPVSGLGSNIRALDLGWDDIAIMSGKLWLTGLSSTSIAKTILQICQNLTNWWELPTNVTEFHGFYAHDERTSGFAPTMPTMTGDIGTRNFNLYGVPGTHSTLVGNLYPEGGATAADNGLANPVGLHVYRSVVKKVAELMNTWHVTFDNTPYKAWLKTLNINDDLSLDGVVAVSSEALSDYKYKAQRSAISMALKNPMNHSKVTLGLTDGRGVYVGGNKQDRKWKPECSIVEFMNEQNTKSKLDSIWQMVVGSETKLEKLGGHVKAHSYNRAGSNWL